jgi:sulfur-oxidizing protein SoxZ
MADPMRIRAVLQGDSTEVRVLMSHEMETGQRKDAQGKVIPAWFIQNVTATWNGKTVLAAEWGPAVAKNPFVSFSSRAAR